MNRYSRVAGTGSYLPEKVLTNKDLEKTIDTTDEWIRTRTGIERRHIAGPEESSSSLAEHAARRALKSAGATPSDVDFIVVGTTTPDPSSRTPARSCRSGSTFTAAPRFP